ncbi:Angiopoietin- protein 1 [Bulinus truncatus]|nr:Angiopoietin- protein 1 [Bulinus truncatus]
MLRIEMEEWSGKKYYAVYNYFRVDSLKHNYRLHISGYHGNAGDAMTSPWETHDNMPFSTKDQDNDGRFYDSCAEHYKGGWWFNNCFEAHLNGKYYHKGFHKHYFQRDGIQWNTIHMYSSLKAVQMMVKPADNPRSTASNELSSNV